MDNNGYPEEEELSRLRETNFLNWQDVLDFLGLIQSCWKYPDGFVLTTDNNTLRLELHTYGWSGCEDVIDALMENVMFWSLFWQESKRGGHYVFEFKPSMFSAIHKCFTGRTREETNA